MSFSSFWELNSIGHYRLKHRWQGHDGLTIRNNFSKESPFPLVTESGMIQYHTERCNMRGCWACAHRRRSKLKDKVNRFVRTTVNKAKKAWRFVTFTLPGSWYDVRHAGLEQQLKNCKIQLAILSPKNEISRNTHSWVLHDRNSLEVILRIENGTHIFMCSRSGNNFPSMKRGNYGQNLSIEKCESN